MSSIRRPLSGRAVSIFRVKPIVRALSGFVGVVPVVAWAQLPTGGAVVAGDATISQAGANHLQVQQGSAKAILNWQQFSIGQEGYVQFIQPNASAIALNRVVGADPSAILGTLSANGQVFLINPNGIVFGAGAQVDVGGLVATTLDINDDDFMAGDFHFEGAGTGAQVVNLGSINAAKGGYVVLAGDYVDNQGVIQAQAGTALLASGKALTLQLSGSSLIDFAVDEASVVELAGVNNAGQILANGGRVIMTAKVANDLAATVVNNDGLIQARSTAEKDGAVYLLGDGGSVANSGAIDASAQVGAEGGYVEMRASHDVVHAAGSEVTVSGADSGRSNAGEVYTWADGVNRYEKGAYIEARGGQQGGDGGLVELSGNAVINRSLVDLRAPNGQHGTLLLDPTQITIAQGSGASDVIDPENSAPATVYEEDVEAQLQMGDLKLGAVGPNANINLADLTANGGDGVLDGTNGGTGGSLTLSASGAGSSITFANTTNTIRVDRDLTLTANDGAAGYAGTTINVGNLVAGQGSPTGGGLNDSTAWSVGLKLDAGAITATSLTLGQDVSSTTDSVYLLDARAYSGDLTVNGDVDLDVFNASIAGIKTTAKLRADAGNVTVTGDVNANASGQGYFQYNWETDGLAAQTYYGDQPWTQTSTANHAITTVLDIDAGGDVTISGATNALATDTADSFQSADTMGGFWQTAEPTLHIFWRATAPTATAAVNAGGDASFGGAVSVKADGYVTRSYDENEYWHRMGQQYETTTQQQSIYDSIDSETGQYVNLREVDVTTSAQNGTTGNYVWSQSGYNAIGSGPYTYHHTTGWSVGSSGSGTGPMSYSGVSGPSAALDLTAAGEVAMAGMDVTSTNRANNGSGNYSDVNWGRQNTLNGGKSQHDANTVSGAQEEWWHDEFSTSYQVANSTALVDIDAGGSVTLAGGTGVAYDVISSHPANSLAAAGMTITAGTDALDTITVGAPLTVRGASGSEVALTVTNNGGDIVHTGAITVTNGYGSGDAKSTFVSQLGGIALSDISVTGGRDATASIDAAGAVTTGNVDATGNSRDAVVAIDATSAATTGAIEATGLRNATIDGAAGTLLTLTGDVLATVTGSVGAADIDLVGATGVVAQADVVASAVNGGYTHTGGINPYTYTVDGGVATVDIQAADGDIDLQGDAQAAAYKAATMTVAATGAGHTLSTAADTDVAASAAGVSYTNSPSSVYTVPTYSATTTLTANGGMTLDSSVAAALTHRNGVADVTLTTTGGSDAAISQGAGSTIKADGSTGTVLINAGAAEPDDSSAAAFTLTGDIQALSATGAANVRIVGSGGQVNGVSAIANNNAALVDIDALTGDLALTGSGAVTGYQDASNGAKLDVSTAGDLDGTGSMLQVKNNHSGASAGAVAALTAGGDAVVGGVGVGTNGQGNSVVGAYGDTGVTAAGALAATALAGNATVTLSTVTGAADIAASGSASATSTNGLASVSLAGVSGVSVAGDIAAHNTSGGALVDIDASVGGVTVVDGATVTVESDLSYATLDVDANTAIDFAGDAALNAGWNNASLSLTADGVTIGGALTATAGNSHAEVAVDGGATGIVVATGGALGADGADQATLSLDAAGDIVSDGALTATASSGAAAMTLDSVSGDVTLDDNAVTEVSSLLNNASLTLDGADITVGGATDVISSNFAASFVTTGTGDTTLNGGVTVQGGQTAALTATSAGALTVGSDAELRAIASAISANITLTSSATPIAGDAIVLDGDLSAMSNGWADIAVTTTGANASIAQGVDSLVTAGGNNSADVTFTSTGAMILNGDIVAAATSDGTMTGVHTGSADINLNTTGGASASITQGSASVISAVGASASMGIAAGDSDPETNPTQAAAFDLNGALQVIDAPAGGSTLVISGASGSVHDFEVTGGSTSAKATITAYDGDLILDGIGSVTGNADSATGALLAVTATGALDTSAASLSIDNTNAGADAGALATLTAASSVTLGNVAVGNAGSGSAELLASADAIGVTGALSANATHDALVKLTAADGSLVVAPAGYVAATSGTGAAAVVLDGAHGLVIDGTVNAAGHTTTVTLDSAAAMTINGAVVTNAALDSTIVAKAQQIEIGADGTLSSTAGLHDAKLDVQGANGLVVDGNAVATSTSGHADVNLATTGGTTATISQGGSSIVDALGASAAVTITAGSHTPAQMAAIDLNGSVVATATHGAADLKVNAARGSMADFAVAATHGTAEATIASHSAVGTLVLDGNGSVTGDSDTAAGGNLQVTAAGALDARAATLSVGNSHAGNNAGAEAMLDAVHGSNQLGSVDVTAAGNGTAAVFATGSGNVSVAAASASGATAVIDIAAANGSVSLGNIATVAGGDASVVVDAAQGITQQADTAIGTAAAQGLAKVDLTSGGNVVLRDIAAQGLISTVQVDAAGTLTATAGTTVDAVASGGGSASLALQGGRGAEINGNLTATGKQGSDAVIAITTGDDGGATANLRQAAGSAILAQSAGGVADVLLEATRCCDAGVDLLGTTTAIVNGGAGDAGIRVHGHDVTTQKLTAGVAGTGTGDSSIALVASGELTVDAVLDSQAVDPQARAELKLIADKLVYNDTKPVLSQNNGHVQLAPFNTDLIIGVDSQPDFDEHPKMHYSPALMARFVNIGAELEFGGKYDRTPWLDGAGKAWVTGMSEWEDILQQTGDIHVAGAKLGGLRLANTTLEFDTSGTTYYHDMKMSPWSVPEGRTAIYVPPPRNSLDRYLDRTENAMQQSFGDSVSASATAASSTGVRAAASVMAPEGTVALAGDMFMAGDGVNMVRTAGTTGTSTPKRSTGGHDGADGVQGSAGAAGADDLERQDDEQDKDATEV